MRVSQRSLVSCCICDTVTMLLKTPQRANRVSRNKKVEEIPNLQADICNNHARSKLFSAVEARGFWSTCTFFKRNESKHRLSTANPFAQLLILAEATSQGNMSSCLRAMVLIARALLVFRVWKPESSPPQLSARARIPSHMWLVHW